MLSKSGNVRSPLPDSSEQVWLDLAKMAGFRPDSSRFDHTWSDPGHFDQILPDQ
jgi:hypothetical protein